MAIRRLVNLPSANKAIMHEKFYFSSNISTSSLVCKSSSPQVV